MRLVVFLLVIVDILGYTGILTSTTKTISDSSIWVCSILLGASLVCGVISTWLYAAERNSFRRLEW